MTASGRGHENKDENMKVKSAGHTIIIHEIYSFYIEIIKQS